MSGVPRQRGRACWSRSAPRPRTAARTSPWRRRPPTACCCACSTSDGDGDPASRCRTTTPGSGTGSCRASGPGRRTATAPRARSTRPAGCAATRPSCCSTRTPGPSAARSASDRRSSATSPATPTRPSALDSAATCRAAWWSTPTFAWSDRPAPAPPVRRHRHLRGARQGLHGDPPRRAGRAARHLRRAGPRGGHRPPARPRRHRGRAAPGAPQRARGVPGRARPDQLLGLQHHRLLRSARRLLRRGPRRAGRAARSPSSRPWSTPCTRAGLEVLLDVVFNHTAEGDQLGPTLCHRGLDNAAYYRLDPDDPRRYLDTTGCGNSLERGDPLALQLIMDSLRYWLTEMRVDGFRFDLAPTLAREHGGFDRVSAFFDLVSQDPVVSRAKLIAEPWDVGQADSYDVGRFPPLWREWNGRYRDTVRDFWRSHEGLLGEFATRFTGSSDLYGGRGTPTDGVGQPDHRARRLHARRPGLLRRQAQRGQRRGQPRRHRRQPLVELRRRGARPPTRRSSPCAAARAAPCSRRCCCPSACRCCSAATSSAAPSRATTTPTARTTRSPGSTGPHVDEDLLAFTRRLIALRRAHPVFRRRRFLAGADAAELRWFTPAGTPMTAADWADPGARSVALYLDGADAPDRADDGSDAARRRLPRAGQRLVGAAAFVVPATRTGQVWAARSTPSTRAPQSRRRSSSRPKRCWWGPVPCWFSAVP